MWGVGHSSQDCKCIHFPGAHLFTCFSGSGSQNVAGWTAEVAWETAVCSTCSSGWQNWAPHLSKQPATASLPWEPTHTSHRAGELVRDKYQGLVSCQSHRENTAGSTSLVAELVVYRLVPAPSLCVYLHVYICLCAGAWASLDTYRGEHLALNVLQKMLSWTLVGCWHLVNLQTLDQEALLEIQLLLLSTFKYKYHNLFCVWAWSFCLCCLYAVQVMP